MRGASWHGADSEIPTSSVIDAVMSSKQPLASALVSITLLSVPRMMRQINNHAAAQETVNMRN